MPHPTIPALSLAIALLVTGCTNSSGTGSGDVQYDPPTTQFAAALGIVTPPAVTADQAKAIAGEAAGGTAISVDQETEGGELLYEVQVETSGGRKEVEVRASDGSVAEIEAADND